jgi:hypothetical protein
MTAEEFNAGSRDSNAAPSYSIADSQDLNAGSHNSFAVSLESNAGARDFPLPAFSA